MIVDIKKILNDIEILRKNLDKLIEEKSSNLQDPEIIEASQVLDEAISKLNRLIFKKL
ncbi:Spo0E like sporulation regulatory protein [Natronincola peptidivorans]|uniref:Spo0E like sporulation regulatory protein n=1 Tax=Natronincola peptidivorans TaxID=426128 RepID=A0A1I0A2P4_9FIRM|nr:aspartyl-phosphate phosphatase Spo0E family protein [Natronincola peptidivorans]SES88410.1 Spo0E like sporulation regulatory protein [Natronincola peptidivorans]